MRRNAALIAAAIAFGICLAFLAAGLIRNALIHRDWAAQPALPQVSQPPPTAVKMDMPLVPPRFTVVR